jgi:hypothetical protein
MNIFLVTFLLFQDTDKSYGTIIRRDREGRLGEGADIYTFDSLVVKRRPDLEIAGLELL